MRKIWTIVILAGIAAVFISSLLMLANLGWFTTVTGPAGISPERLTIVKVTVLSNSLLAVVTGKGDIPINTAFIRDEGGNTIQYKK